MLEKRHQNSTKCTDRGNNLRLFARHAALSLGGCAYRASRDWASDGHPDNCFLYLKLRFPSMTVRTSFNHVTTLLFKPSCTILATLTSGHARVPDVTTSATRLQYCIVIHMHLSLVSCFNIQQSVYRDHQLCPELVTKTHGKVRVIVRRNSTIFLSFFFAKDSDGTCILDVSIGVARVAMALPNF